MDKNPNKYIRAAYELYLVKEGTEEFAEKTPRQQPFIFISGTDYVLDAFEKGVYGLQKGDTFDFTVPREQAFGDYNPDHRQEYDRSVFEIEGKFDEETIFEGNTIQMERSDHTLVNATVISVGPQKVVIDFNHPYAGSDLRFKGEIIEARDATPQEVNEFIKQLQGGCEGCGGCSGCQEEGEGCGSQGGCGHCH